MSTEAILSQLEQGNEPPVATKKKTSIFKLLKMAMPHLALYTLLFCYLMAGAWAFGRIEFDAERLQTMKKMERIEEIYRRIASEMRDECRVGKQSEAQFNSALYKSLTRISEFMERRDFRFSPEEEWLLDELLPPKWNPISSVLYALSILTTTGYGSAAPMTPLGQWFSIAYGLLGIPLMILAAVDIGRFLSDVVLWVYVRLDAAMKKLCALFGIEQKKKSVVAKVETKALQVLQNTRRRTSFRRGSGKKKLDAAAGKTGGSGEILEKGRDAEEGRLEGGDGKKSRKGVMTRKKRSKSAASTITPPIPPKKHLPLSVNAAILLLFCMLGGIVYITAAGHSKTFIEGFFVTFNLVANLTMSEMPGDISQFMTLVYIFVFVTFGLAVLSMCAELAASELKWIFLKIHYFGRKINWKRKRRDEQRQMEIEVKELLKIIDLIRARYPHKEAITSNDILKYVQELNGGNFANGSYGKSPFRTFNMFLVQQQALRRDTMAFQPRTIDALKFADEMDLEDVGWVGRPPPPPPEVVDAAAQRVLVTQEELENYLKKIRKSDPNTFIPFMPFISIKGASSASGSGNVSGSSSI